MALWRVLSSNLLSKSLSPARSAAPFAQSVSRLLNTNAARDFDDESDSEEILDLDRRQSRSAFRRGTEAPTRSFSDAFDPFSSTRSLSQILNALDQLKTSPFAATARGSTLRQGWDAKEMEDGLHLRIDMPGLGKEHVKVTVEQNTLIIKGEGEEVGGADEESGGARRYTSRIDLPEKVYKVDQIKAEMKNGVLKVLVPKLRAEEREDVFHVAVD